MITIFLAESENRVCDALQVILEQGTETRIVGQARHTESLLAQVCLLVPDVILLDWNLPGIHPQRLIRTLREFCPDTILVATSVQPEQEIIAKDWGVDGFLLKQLPPDLFIAALDTVLQTRSKKSKET